MRLIHDNILTTKLTEDEKSKAGIILGKSATKKNLAKVVQIGNKVKHVKVGDTIKYYEFAGEELTYDGNQFLLLKESIHLVGILCE